MLKLTPMGEVPTRFHEWVVAVLSLILLFSNPDHLSRVETSQIGGVESLSRAYSMHKVSIFTV